MRIRRYAWMIAALAVLVALPALADTLEGLEEDEIRPQFLCRIVHEQNHAPFHGFNRAQAAVVEMERAIALTIDFVDGLGEHTGGYILPGMAMLSRALQVNTAGIEMHDDVPASGVLGLGTRAGVEQGTKTDHLSEAEVIKLREVIELAESALQAEAPQAEAR